MFHDLDATLRALLDDAGAPADVRAADVSFSTPDKDFKPGLPTVDLFLHDVAENLDLRRAVPHVDAATGPGASGFTRRRASLRVDCTYLVTTWSDKTAALKAEEEHRLLGSTLLWVSRFPVIDPRFLQGTLKAPPQPYPLPALVSRAREGAHMGEFWAALGIAPRPAFSLTATIALQPVDEVEALPAVEEVRVEGVLSTAPMLVGRVLEEVDGGLAPVPGARVTVVGTGQQALVGPTGRFAFGDVELGDVTLLVQVTGRPDVQAAASYAADSQVHDVILPGP